MLIVRADGHTLCTVQSVNRAHAVLEHLYKGQRASACVSAEDRYCVINTASGVDMLIVRADSHAPYTAQSVNRSHAVLEHLYKGQRASACVSAEDHYCIIKFASGVDMLIVRADGHTLCTVQSVNRGHVVLVHLYKG